MRTAKKLFALLFILATTISFQSCSDSSDGEVQELFISFTINGESIDIRGDARVASASGGTDLSINGNNGLDPTDAGYVSISLQLPDGSVSTGTFDFSGTPFTPGDYECVLTVGQDSFLFLTTGSVTITGRTADEITGTFSGTRVENGNTTITITNGSFRALTI